MRLPEFDLKPVIQQLRLMHAEVGTDAVVVWRKTSVMAELNTLVGFSSAVLLVGTTLRGFTAVTAALAIAVLFTLVLWVMAWRFFRRTSPELLKSCEVHGYFSGSTLIARLMVREGRQWWCVDIDSLGQMTFRPAEGCGR